MSSKPDNPYLRKEGELYVITEEGYKKLSEFVTNPTGQVYAFNGTLSAVIVAAAMARLSRRAGDMRLTILDEFILDDGEDADQLIRRVVSEYGDDSVQQLVGVQYVVEGASNLLTKILERRRFASYLEQSTRYIYFDLKDANDRYLYYIPQLSDDLRRPYVQTMDTIFDCYSTIVRGITEYLRKKNPEPADRKERAAWVNSTRATACDAVRPVLPAATKSTVGIFASAQAADLMIMDLLSDRLPEALIVGNQLLGELRKIIPAFLERTDQPSRGGMISAYRFNTRAAMRNLAERYIDYRSPKPPSNDVQLVSYWPESELDLVPEMLFEHSEPLSLSEIQEQVSGFDEGKKEEIFSTYMGERLNRRQRPGRALEKAHFEWEIVGDYGTFRDLQRHRVVDSWEWQRLSPAFGYDVPDLVSEAGFEDEFRSCFELSAKLFYALSTVDEFQAQYATLFGHRMRYRFIMNLRQLFHFLELRTGPTGHPGYRKICNKMFDILKVVYPLSGAGMIFVNQGEDPELVRLAAERAAQFKLEQLDSLK